MDTVSEFHAEAPQATSSEGLAQGPYVATRAGFEPATLRTKGDESTNEPPLPVYCYSLHYLGEVIQTRNEKTNTELHWACTPVPLL